MIFNDNGTTLTAANFVTNGIDKIYSPFYQTLGSSFNGLSPNTQWGLFIFDKLPADIANLTYWEVSVRSRDAAGVPDGCGDSLKRPGENCEDGYNDGLHGCLPGCASGVMSGFYCSGGNYCAADICNGICGDNITTVYEPCDDANIQANDGCTSLC